MPTVVQFGAGAIGRGFLAQLWTEAGYEVVFADINTALVDALNRYRSFPLHLVTYDSWQELLIQPVRAVAAQDTSAVLEELRTCAFAATAVGPHLDDLLERVFLPHLLARGKARRNTPLNIFVGENNPLAAAILRSSLKQFLQQHYKDPSRAMERIGFLQTIVGRMVPTPHLNMESCDGLRVVAEPYKDLPFEPREWKGDPLPIPYVHEQLDFSRYVQKKLYIHNAGHAVLAYHGYQKGYTYLYECATDPALIAEVRGFWGEVNSFLQGGFLSEEKLIAFQDELILRFQNRVLADTVVRVARDPARKLHAADRLVWPVQHYIMRMHKTPEYGIRAIAAALRFDFVDDPSACQIQQLIQEKGVGQAFVEISGIPPDDPRGIVPLITAAYQSGKAI